MGRCPTRRGFGHRPIRSLKNGFQRLSLWRGPGAEPLALLAKGLTDADQYAGGEYQSAAEGDLEGGPS
jgi:hypothetical protein